MSETSHLAEEPLKRKILDPFQLDVEKVLAWLCLLFLQFLLHLTENISLYKTAVRLFLKFDSTRNILLFVFTKLSGSNHYISRN